MKTSRYSDPQILAILRQAEGGVPVAELCREHGMSDASFYKWRAKYGGMDASMVSQMKAIEDENRRHHGMVSPSQRVNVPVGPSGPSSATRTASRAPSSTVSVPEYPLRLVLV